MMDLIEDKLLIGQRGGKKPCTQLDSNPLPLSHKACALPQCYHCCPRHWWDCKKLKLITASFLATQSFMLHIVSFYVLRTSCQEEIGSHKNRILMQPHPFLRFSPRASSEANGINGLIQKWMYATIGGKIRHDKKLSCPFPDYVGTQRLLSLRLMGLI